MFVFGIVLAILGALFGLPEMRTRIAIDLAQQGDMLLVLFFGVFVSTLLVGPLIDSFGNKRVLTLSAGVVATMLVAFGLVHSYGAAMLTAFLLGFGGGGLNTSANALVADVYPENRGAMLNILGTFFGVGALLIPAIAPLFSIDQLLLISAALAAMACIAYAMITFPEPRERVGFALLASLRAARMPA